MELRLPQTVRGLLDRLESNGFEAWVVGGCVRDSLLGLTPHDWDVTTDALPGQVADCFADCRVIETGLRHGTVTVLASGEPYEITTFRVDGRYSDGRHPDKVEFVRSLREDLARRDFTVNAMAYSPRRGLADCFGGRADLDARLIRCVGDPDVRFGEDALRILRALRFASTYGFSIEERTAESLRANRERLRSVAAERIAAELNRLLTGRGAADQLGRFPEVFAVFLPELAPMFGFEQRNPHHDSDVWAHTLRALAQGTGELEVGLAILLHDCGKPRCFTVDENGVGHFYGHAQVSAELARGALRRLRYDNATTARVVKLVLHHDTDLFPLPKRIRRLLHELGEELLWKLLAVKRADILAQAAAYREENLARLAEARACLERVLAEGQRCRLEDLALDGRDLLALGAPEGRAVGECLRFLLDRVIDGGLENRREPLEAAARAFLTGKN